MRLLLVFSIPKMEKLLQVKNLKNYFPILSPFFKRHIGYIRVVDDICFDLESGKILGLVGESGCGKTTLGRTLVQTLKPTEGAVIFQGQNIVNQSDKNLKPIRRHMQMIFQDPYSSLNPKHRVKTILEEPLRIYESKIKKSKLEDKIITVLKEMSLSSDDLMKFPHEFSGGQRQRIAIARTLILKPKLIIADEPVSALDVSVQAQIINLLKEWHHSLKISFLFISHDLSVVQHLADDVIVMYLGKIIEQGSKEQVFSNPLHPYTQQLIESIPKVNPQHKRKELVIRGEASSPYSPPQGCHFHPRCPAVKDICKTHPPGLKNLQNNHKVSCHLYP